MTNRSFVNYVYGVVTIGGLIVNKEPLQFTESSSQPCTWTISVNLLNDNPAQDILQVQYKSSLYNVIASFTNDANDKIYYYGTVSVPSPTTGNATGTPDNITISTTTSIYNLAYTGSPLICTVGDADPSITHYGYFYDSIRNEGVFNIQTTILYDPVTVCSSSVCGPTRVVADRHTSPMTRTRIYEITFSTSTTTSSQMLSILSAQATIPSLFSSSVQTTVSCPPSSITAYGYKGAISSFDCQVEMTGPSVLTTQQPAAFFFPTKGNRTSGVYTFYFYTQSPATHILLLQAFGTSNFVDRQYTITFTKMTSTYFINSIVSSNNTVAVLPTNPSALMSFSTTKNLSPSTLTWTVDDQLRERMLYHTFPFSFGYGNADSYVHTLSLIIPSFYQFSPFKLTVETYGTSNFLTVQKSVTGNEDIIAPQLLNINYQFLDYNSGIIKLKIKDLGSGVKKIVIAGNELTINDLLNGTVRDGWFSKEISFSMFGDYVTAILIYDIAGNVKEYSMDALYIDENQSLKTIPNIYTISRMDVFNIGNVAYSHIDIINVTTQTQPFWIAFDLVSAPFVKSRWSPQLLVLGNGMATQRKIVTGRYDGDAYYIRWDVPIGSIPGELPFLLINRDISSQLLRLRKVLSVDGPTIVNKGLYTQATGPKFVINAKVLEVVITPGGTGGVISWTGVIFDYALFASAQIVIQGSEDPLPYQFAVLPNATGIFEISIPIASNCKTQNYTVSRLEVVTITKQLLTYDPYYGIDSINPLSGIDLINIKCTPTVDNTPPDVTAWNVIEVIPRYRYKVDYTVQEQGTSGLSARHIPVVYALNSAKDLLSFNSTRQGATNTIQSTYTAIIDLPYGFVLGGGFGLSLYGLVDNNLNFNGYSTYDLESLGFKAYFPTFDIIDPVITSIDPLTQDSKGVGQLVVKGDAFGSPLQLATVKGFIQCDGGAIIPVQSSHLPINLFSMSLDHSHRQLSTVTNFTVASYAPPPVPAVICPNNCNSRGNCTSSGCVCTSPYIGSDCLGQTDNATKTTIDQTVPTTSFLTNQTDANNTITATQIVTTISLVEIREMDIDDKEVVSYKQLNWTPYNLTLNSTEKQVFLYNTTIQGDKATINVTLEYLEMEQTYNFANQNFTVPSQSVKYSVAISNYVFASQLNHMVLLFNTSIGRDECASKEAGYLDSSNNLLAWIELSVGQNVLYARFQQNAIVDDRIVSIQNSIVPNNNTNSVNNTALVGIHLPIFSNYAIIDPDFSLLLTDKKVTTTCINGEMVEEEKNENWKVIVIAVVCSAVGATVLVIATVYILKKNKWRIREQTIKLRRRKPRGN
ncbi:hypothetical protein DFA_08441 [Cavenderia fasciculata]|uniref:EGF-like domain-containing protein n=1 Tax=Cavenderia fasciculata TaxID=261658 RepID=F4Q672_CACFS|nr:uncharacterized protein DFA_08441 [Cavenderia fasciculata]EGG17446.1 hypothetical protein DFA_08441 [Cavenderia fasciculata]|eukprot:XP_004355930.1 hypothetical protein DFA_08441 [Cavenderia fasciculata]